MNDPSSSRSVDLPATVTRYIDAIDVLLERGRAAQARHDQFCLRHNIRPELTEEKLFGPSVPPANRHIHRRLLGLMEGFYTQILGPTPAQRPSLTCTARRALGSRNRI